AGRADLVLLVGAAGRQVRNGGAELLHDRRDCGPLAQGARVEANAVVGLLRLSSGLPACRTDSGNAPAEVPGRNRSLEVLHHDAFLVDRGSGPVAGVALNPGDVTGLRSASRTYPVGSGLLRGFHSVTSCIAADGTRRKRP